MSLKIAPRHFEIADKHCIRIWRYATTWQNVHYLHHGQIGRALWQFLSFGIMNRSMLSELNFQQASLKQEILELVDQVKLATLKPTIVRLATLESLLGSERTNKPWPSLTGKCQLCHSPATIDNPLVSRTKRPRLADNRHLSSYKTLQNSSHTLLPHVRGASVVWCLYEGAIVQFWMAAARDKHR